MGAISSSTRSIEQDHKDIQSMFSAAKMGKWPEVWRILGTPSRPLKPYLINIIPEDRRWGLLQQAVWWNNSSAIKKLIQFQACDKDLKAKDSISEKGPTGGHTAQQIAELFGYLEVSNIIKNHIPSIREEDIETYYDGNSSIENEEYGLFRLTLAAYKGAFHPSYVDKTKQLSVLLNDVFKHVNTANNWMAVRDKVAQALNSSCEEASKVVSQCTTKLDFYRRIVNVYTDETTQLYTNMNTALRRQRDTGFKPTANDLALGPYILMFHLLLFCWRDLVRERTKTYRKMKISARDLAKYQPGTKFTWLSFISSSVQQQCAQIFPSCAPSGDLEVHFVIDNSTDSQWQPLNIEDYACYTEKERVYPAGAQFLIKRRSTKNGVPTIQLKLLACLGSE
ncbi:uncharacterized protein LOC127713048 [Mytilus californianus]|uniref:uncharacterized protein LOC127713048 n=1 Tax=Mytilus californianus TaxID=6549 RepID=UPI0022462760|nr:uncharacterized protein LOC127713048 [Mytilus californianus]